MKKFADVMLPLPLPDRYTYSLPDELSEKVKNGCRVIVPFGRKKFYTAIVTNLHDCPPETYETKEIVEVLDENPILLPAQYKFWTWIASYYLCTEGDVYKAALPSGMKIESETLIELNPDFIADTALPEKEQRILDLLSGEPVQRITQLEKAGSKRISLSAIQSLLDKKAIYIKEELKRNYKPKTETCVRLAEEYRDEEKLHRLFDQLERIPKQLALLMKYTEMAGLFGTKPAIEVNKKELLVRSGYSPAVFSGLLKKHIFETYDREIGRLAQEKTVVHELHPLNPAQQEACRSILASFKTKDVCLLHGVTSSGKTEIYIHLIRQAIQAGKQVLYLLPEIALTTQITERLKRVFGSRLGIYHSKFSDAERVEIWQKQLGKEPYDILLGVRSSIFLPFQHLGLVIVDEEHENSYKQQDPAPRYHARNAAIMLAYQNGAKTLLGTATPSIESYYNALQGKYGLVTLTERYQDIQLPEIRIVDIQELIRKKVMKTPFSPQLTEEIRKALENKEQVILFQNRRGFAPMIECRTCGWIPKCRHCDVSLTYHKRLNLLTCHYCGATYPVPCSCPACEGTELLNRGFGTEKIEDDILQIFPEAKVARMDLDTTRARAAYERIINDFQERKTDILIGTQMVSKGLDFDRVSVVGILNADTMLNVPDFRAHERAFQLMAQVAGRAGRKSKRGLVILQTKSATLPVIRQVVEYDYAQLYNDQLQERRLFRYPPFHRLIYVYLKHRKEEVLEAAADKMAALLHTALGERVLGPDKPPIARIQALFIRKIIIKVEQGASQNKICRYLQTVQHTLTQEERFRSLLVYYDVDPQ